MLSVDEIRARRPLEVVVAGPLSNKDFLRFADGRLCVAVNRGLWAKPQAFTHYVSYHSDNLAEIQRGWRGITWVQRPASGLSATWGHLVDNMFSGGSSALFGVSVALQYLGATHITLTGVTLEHPDYHQYRDAWRSHAGLLRSCVHATTNGWVKRFLEGNEA